MSESRTIGCDTIAGYSVLILTGFPVFESDRKLIRCLAKLVQSLFTFFKKGERIQTPVDEGNCQRINCQYPLDGMAAVYNTELSTLLWNSKFPVLSNWSCTQVRDGSVRVLPANQVGFKHSMFSIVRTNSVHPFCSARNRIRYLKSVLHFRKQQFAGIYSGHPGGHSMVLNRIANKLSENTNLMCYPGDLSDLDRNKVDYNVM